MSAASRPFENDRAGSSNDATSGVHVGYLEPGRDGAIPRVAGIDGTPGGWAVLTLDKECWSIRKVGALVDFLRDAGAFDLVAIDVPIGLLASYELGGRVCDRAARAFLGRQRGSSVFPAPVRSVLDAESWEDACARSRRSAPNGKAVTKQTYAILDKIREVDDLLRSRPELREIVLEVHPEVSFCELAGSPMFHRKSTALGREQRKQALIRCFPELPAIETRGRSQGLPAEDILDATIACWSALRLVRGRGRSLPAVVPIDTHGLPMAIWV